MGSLSEPQTKDADGNPLRIKHGPNEGQARVEYFMGLAIPKSDPGYAALWAQIHQAARDGFPTLFNAAGELAAPKFAFKVIDGDSQVPNTKGARPCDKEGFPGHWVLCFSSGFASKCYKEEAGSFVEYDAANVDCGHYIRIAGTVAANGSQQNPGVYLNHSMIQFIGYGDRTVTGPNAESAFGAAPVGALPQGCSLTPPAGAPMPTAAPAALPGVTPAPDFLQPPGVAAAPPAALAPPVAAAPPAVVEVQYIASDGNPYTAARLRDAGFTPEQIQALPTA